MTRVAIYLIFITSIVYAGQLVNIAEVGATNKLQTSSNPSEKLAKKLENPEFREKFIESRLQEIKQNRYKISTPELTIGEINTYKQENKYLPQPFALVGCDRTSMKWLDYNRKELLQVKPQVYVINCDDKAEFNVLTQIVDLKFLAVQGSQFAKTYNLKHYPVLITKDYVTQ